MFRNELPRVYELRDLIEDPNAPTSYFHNFEKSILDHPGGESKKRTWLSREKEFQRLDKDSWEFLKNKARPYLTTKQTNGRGWEQLISILNEVRGYVYLSDVGCSRIQFIPEAGKENHQTPELQGELDSTIILCEVKTLFVSEDEVRRSREREAGTIENQLSTGFFKKLKSAIDKAQGQIKAYKEENYESAENVRRIVYIIPNFDDFLGEYKANYYKQIDEYLDSNSVPEIEIVFYNELTAFTQTISMTNATVVNPQQ